jgi:hypothetical protein
MSSNLEKIESIIDGLLDEEQNVFGVYSIFSCCLYIPKLFQKL